MGCTSHFHLHNSPYPSFGKVRSRQRSLGGDWTNLLSVTFKRANQICLLSLEPAGNSATLSFIRFLRSLQLYLTSFSLQRVLMGLI